MWLLALFLSYQASITFFAHVHIVNGVMFVHSHPVPGKHHTHTAGQVITIAQLSDMHTLEAELTPHLEVVLPVLYALEPTFEPSCIVPSRVDGIYLRAPPCCG